MKAEIEQVSYVSLSVDAWTSNRQDSYLGITAHYIYKDEFQSACLDCSIITVPQTAINIAQRVREVMDDWNIRRKVTAIVTDNGKNMVKAVKDYLKIRHLACSAHTLNLVVNDAVTGTAAVNALFDRSSNIVTFFR